MTDKKKSRADKLEETRRALFEAAVYVVGEEGYAAASVDKIVAEANVAKGTFYNYFENQQDLFNQLLPNLGQKLLEYIRNHLDDSLTGIDRERRRIECYFEFCKITPGFLRILNEAEIFAPQAFHRHVNAFYEGYYRSIQRSVKRKEISGYDDDELAIVVFMLMGIRSYVTMLYQDKQIKNVPVDLEKVIRAYTKFVDRALFSR